MVGVIVISIIVFCFALIFWAVKARQKRRIKIDRYGIATVGTVVRKPRSTSQYGTSSYGIIFEFEHDCQVFVKKIWVLDKREYDNAIIGMTYEVKYLPNRPKTAIIFIDRPMGKIVGVQDNTQQRKTFINRKRNRILFVIGMVVAFAAVFWLGRIERETRSNIESYGRETVGTIISKGRGSSSGGRTYSVRFEFEHSGEGEKVIAHMCLHGNRRLYEKAIVGEKYKVKYLPNVPHRNGRSIIFIDKPVPRTPHLLPYNHEPTTIP